MKGILMFRLRNWFGVLLLFTLVLTACSTPSPTEAFTEPDPDSAEPTPVSVEESLAVAAEDGQAGDTETGEDVAPLESAAQGGMESAEQNAVTRTFQIVPQASEASYAVEEEFFNRAVRFVTAIGRTSTIEGEFNLTIEGNQIQLGENGFVVDLRTLTSDSGQRDRRIRSEWLESNTYPWAEFRATEVRGFPAVAAEGQDVEFELAGDMTIREVTQPLVFDTTARLEGDILTATAVTYMYMRDFGFEPPNILGMLTVTDGVTVTVELTAQEGTSEEAAIQE
jgi:polyisoprenoid-binding protein YceI